MAQPIPLHLPLQGTERKEEHAEAIRAALDLLQELHNHGLLDLARGVVASSPELITRLAEAINTPNGIAVIRDLLFALKIVRTAANGLAQSRAILHGVKVFGRVLLARQR
jgi:hypothetical protein